MKHIGMLILFIVIVVGCSKPYRRCEPVYGIPQPYTKYEVKPTLRTAKGIEVDPSGQRVPLAFIDQIVDETETCLRAEFPDGVLPDDVWHAAWCATGTTKRITTSVRRQCLVVKVVNDWFVGRSGDQLLPYGTGGQCLDKGLGPGKCYFRAATQDDLTILVPPEMKLFKAELVKITTGCHNAWNHPKLAKCMGAVKAPSMTEAIP